jgi:hypothetical protein
MKLLKYIKNFFKTLFYTEKKETEFIQVERSPTKPKSSKPWSKPEKTVAAYLALYGYESAKGLREQDIAHILGRSEVALRRKISRLRNYEKTGNLNSVTRDELIIMNTKLKLKNQQSLERIFAQNLIIVGRSNNTRDNMEVQTIINSMYSETFRKRYDEAIEEISKMEDGRNRH